MALINEKYLQEECEKIATNLYQAIQEDSTTHLSLYETIACREYEKGIVDRFSCGFICQELSTIDKKISDAQLSHQVVEELKIALEINIKTAFDKKMKAILHDLHQNDKLAKEWAFSYFYAVFSFYRRKRDFASCKQFFKTYTQTFINWAKTTPKFQFIYHAEVMYLVNEETPAISYETVIKARDVKNLPALEAMADSINHSFAITVASYLEFRLDELHNEENQELLKEALNVKYSEEEWNKYPKFRSTVGRLCALNGDYEKGIQLIKEAIDKDDTHDIQKNIEYDAYLTNVSNIKNIDLILDQSHMIDSKLNDERKKVMKISSISISIITFILGSISVFGKAVQPNQIPGIFLMFFSCILIIEGILIFSFGAWNNSFEFSSTNKANRRKRKQEKELVKANQSKRIKKTKYAFFVDYILPSLMIVGGIVGFILTALFLF